MNINIAALLHANPALLLAIIIGLGLLVGKLSLGPIKLDKALGVLLVAMIFGEMGFTVSAGIQSVGFMLFVFSVGIDAGPHFFNAFLRDGKRYFTLSVFMVMSTLILANILGHIFHLGDYLSAGLFAGGATSTTALVAIQDALGQAVHAPDKLNQALSNLGVGYALSYVTGLFGMMLVVRYLPMFFRLNLPADAKALARQHGLEDDEEALGVLPVIRAYRVGPDLAKFFDGLTLRDVGIYRRTGCYIERIRRNGILAEPDGDATLHEGDEFALLGYPHSHAQLGPLFRNSEEVFDADLLNMSVVTEDVVVKSDSAVGKHLSELNLADQGCFLDRIFRSQIEMPLERDIVLHRGDVLKVCGERSRVDAVAEKIGFINVHSRTTDMVAFAGFFAFGILLGEISLQFGYFGFFIGSTVGLLASGILMGYLRAIHPTFGHVPSGGLRFCKELGLFIFMACMGVSVGKGIFNNFDQSGPLLLVCGLLVGTLPVIFTYLFGRYVLRMNPALLMGALAGARTSGPGIDQVNEMSKSTIPSLGYAGTYAVANVLFTVVGTLLVHAT